jgi:hypothetical protein
MLSSLQGIQDSAKKFVADNATVILTAGGVVGTVSTGILAWRGGYKTSSAYRDARMENIKQYAATQDPHRPLDKDSLQELLDKSEPLSKQEKIVLAFPSTAPAVITGGLTITAIIFSHRMNAQKAAAMAALYGVSQKQFEEYKNKVAEKLTGPKQQQISDELAKEQMDRTPGAEQIVIVEGEVLCFDQLTGRYFRSTMEEIRKAVNDTNEQILNVGSASAGYFYDLLGLPPTSWTNDVGWNTANMLDIEYGTQTSHDGRPCITINPRYLPIQEYDRNHY